jgi:hypothetical protein
MIQMAGTRGGGVARRFFYGCARFRQNAKNKNLKWNILSEYSINDFSFYNSQNFRIFYYYDIQYLEKKLYNINS